MIKSLFKLGLLLLISVLAYNYFFGSEQEKAQSKEIFGKVRDVGRDAWGLLKTEKAKYKEGKYDGAVDKVENTVESIGTLLNKLGTTAKDLNDSGALDRLQELQQKQKELNAILSNETPESYDQAEHDHIQSEIKDLLRETEDLMIDMEQQK